MPQRSASMPLLTHELIDFTEPWRDPPAEVVLLHPGLGGGIDLFRPWVPVLGDRYRVLRVATRGHGLTARPEGYEWSLDNFVQDALDVLDHYDIEKVHWVGQSGGSLFGQHAAATKPKRLSTLTLIGGTSKFKGPPDGDYDKWLEPVEKRGDVRAFFAKDTIARFGSDDPVRAVYLLEKMSQNAPSLVVELHRWVHGIDITDQLPRIGCPTLILTGGAAKINPVEGAQVMVDRIPNARLQVLEGLPHNMSYTHPHQVARAVRAFLEEQDR